ncbi:hypothetical protein [Peterkaempfera sp. SMS 1(5)a]|uniref:hypothetical protein n=1 Tax=Peterkaempfera podocarpi TaxID=3232308 RepID=UPI00366B9D08
MPAAKGNRALSMPGRLIAATAERQRVTVLHDVRGYGVLTSISGRSTPGSVEAGSAEAI